MISRVVAAAVAAAAVLSAPAARAQSFINVLTGGTSGVYYPLGVAIGKIYSDKIPNVKTQVQATKASVENLILLQQGRGEIAFTLGDSLKAAWDGDEEAGFKTQARQAAHHRRDLSELHPDRRHRRQRHQDARRPQGQEPVGRRAQIGHRAQLARDPGRAPA